MGNTPTKIEDTPAQKARKKQERELDEALDDTFPASDPPSQTDPTHGIKRRPAPAPKQKPN